MNSTKLRLLSPLGCVMLLATLALFPLPRVPGSRLVKQDQSNEISPDVMFGVNPQRTRAYDISAVIQPKAVRWKTAKLFVVDRSYPVTLEFKGMPGMSTTTVWRPSGHAFTEPMIKDGTIYFSLYINDGYVFAQHITTGGDKWRFKLTNSSLSSVAVAGGAVFFGSSGGTLFALNAENGEVLWNKTQPGFEFYNAAPLIADNVVFFSSTEYSRGQNVRPNGRIFALELKTGKELWVYNTRTTLGAAANDNKTLVVDDSESQLHAVDATTGQKLWKFKASGGRVWQPAIKNGTVYFSTDDGNLYAVDVQTGRERWKTTKEPKVATLLALDETNIYFGGENLNLYAVDQANGKIKWVYKTKKPCRSLVVGAGIVSFMTDGVMLALDTNTGGEKWKVDGLSKVVSAPIFAPDAIYFLDGEGHLYSLK